MSTWDQAQLRALAAADDLHISPYREDGRTYGTPTWIWSVVVGGDLYVRPYNGRSSRWYQAALSPLPNRPADAPHAHLRSVETHVTVKGASPWSTPASAPPA
ncbi:DUF2255 family protein [Streptomyces mirabilis]|uniref:DUF2255 family protein n=1 Tax=Streptomyces mirabilis TaxID=68239 RepID=UPI00369B04B1